MKVVKLGVVFLAIAILACVFSSCGSVQKTKVSITFLDQNGKVVIEKYTAEIKKENPTVIDVVNALSDAFATLDDYANITISSDGSSVKDVDNYKENLTADENNMIQYWKFLVNGFEPTDDASEATVKDGDTIVYQYVEDTVKAEI